MSLEEKLLARLDELFEKVSEVSTKTECNALELSYIKENTNRNTKDLTEHMEGTRTNRTRIEQNFKLIEDQAKLMEAQTQSLKCLDTRITCMERFPQFLSTIKSILKWISIPVAIIAAIVGFW